MQFDSLQAFLDMGGYGTFVWLAFGVSFAVLILLLVESIVAKRRLFAFIQQELARKQRIKAVKRAKKQSNEQVLAEIDKEENN